MSLRLVISIVSLLVFSCILSTQLIFAQTNCPNCTGSIKDYRTTSPTSVNNSNNPTNDTFWNSSGSPGNSDIARFNDGRNYEWIPNNTTTIRGIILENGSDLILNRFGQGSTPSFVIQGTVANPGCIIVRNGSILDLKYISNLVNVNVCVEEGGRIIFDSRDEDRNDFLFNGVNITLQGPDARIEFGEADIILGTGGVSISGYSGGSNGCIRNSDGSLTLPNPTPNVSADPTKTNIEDYCNFLSAAGFRILPVEYLYFKTTFLAQERAVRLNWATAKEWENSHFEIERAVNGVRSWEKIGEVTGVGWSEMPVEYFFTDEQLPLTGGNIFYRLKQVDFNGDFAYSEVVSARVPSMQVTQWVWRVFPNPTNGNAFRIELLDPKRYNGEALTANLITPLAGKKPLGGNTTQVIGEEVLDLVNVHGKGVYILEITWGNKVEHIKVLKQ